MALLEGHGLSKYFGGVQALADVDFEVAAGTIVGLIGPNGAGKTTLFNIVAGAMTPSRGQVIFDGAPITGLPAYRICQRGVARTFQVTRPFAEMTCLENVAVGIINRHPHLERAAWQDQALEYLAAVGLEAQAQNAAKQLNVVQKKRLEIARSLATEPKLLMLDEVLGGLNTQEIQESVAFIRQLRDQRRLTVFWIEHVMGAIMQAAEKVIVLDQGAVLMEGPPATVVADERVIHAYLGD